jgi:predicted permease
MSVHQPLLDSLRVLLWMVLPIAAGWLLWHRFFQSRPRGHLEAAKMARVLARVALVLFAAPLMILAAWIASLPAEKAVVLPFVGLTVHVTGSAVGWLASRGRGHPPSRQGAFLLAGGCSNVLTFGGITIVFLLRSPDDPAAEAALGELAVYRIFELPFYFLLAWPMAAMVSARGDPSSVHWSTFFRRALHSPAMVPLLGIITGVSLNLSGVARPAAFEGVTDILVRCNILLLGITVGLGLRRAAPLRFLRACLGISAIKFVLLPVLGVSLAWLLGFEGRTLQVVLIAASMPVAFMAVVGAALYRLDEEIIATFWLFTTLAMTVVVPILAMLVRQLA